MKRLAAALAGDGMAASGTVLEHERPVAHGPPQQVLTGTLLSQAYGHPVDVVPRR